MTSYDSPIYRKGAVAPSGSATQATLLNYDEPQDTLHSATFRYTDA
jgi:hypothetical protein